jgi:trehalose 6-phosphate phosphatase
VGAVELTSTEAKGRYDDLAANLSRTVVGLDFDGVLSPIVEDPAQAHIHPDAHDVLLPLATKALAVAVITGRPARQALALGGLDDIGAEIAEQGSELYLFGQYGNERWTATNRRIISPRPPAGLSVFMRELPRLLRSADAAGAHIEEKGLAVAIHTRQLDEPAEAQRRLVPVLTEAAERHDLVVEPGRAVVEVRAGGMHKGRVVETLVENLDAGGFLFAGDDLGDLEAFHAVAALRDKGMATLLVCSASDEQSALVELADVVVPGPDGVLDLLRRLTSDAP